MMHDDGDENCKDIHDGVAAKVVNQGWTRTLRERNIPLFAVEDPGPGEISCMQRKQSLTFLNFFTPKPMCWSNFCSRFEMKEESFTNFWVVSFLHKLKTK